MLLTKIHLKRICINYVVIEDIFSSLFLLKLRQKQVNMWKKYLKEPEQSKTLSYQVSWNQEKVTSYKSKINYKMKITKYNSRSTCDLFWISPLIQIRVSFVDQIKYHKINGTLRHVFEHFFKLVPLEMGS